MQPYTSQLNAMIEALVSGSYSPPPAIAQAFKQRRINAVSKALSMANLFVPVSGNYADATTFAAVSPNATFTVYSKPLQRDVIVLGCALMSADEATLNRILGEFRIRLPEPLSHLSQNYIFPQQAFAPATYSVFFPAPFILRASEQIAVDFGFNAPQANPSNFAQRIEMVLFCVAIKDCLTSEDEDVLQKAIAVINGSDYQRRVLLNSFTHGSIAHTSQTDSPFASGADNAIVYTPPGVSAVPVPRGTLATSETRPADVPLLVVGFGTSMCGDGIRITDTGTGHSFTQGEFIYTHNLYYPEELISNTENMPYYGFFKLPVPHLLKPGATLFMEHVSGFGDSEQVPFNPEFAYWECLTP